MKILEIAAKCLAFAASFVRVTDEGSLPEIVQYDPSSHFECFPLPKGLTIIFVILFTYPLIFIKTSTNQGK